MIFQVVSIISKCPFQCRVKLLPKKHNGAMKTVFGKQIAIATPSPVIIPVGTRVVAIFQDVFSTNYYSGVIAEPPKILNKSRYNFITINFRIKKNDVDITHVQNIISGTWYFSMTVTLSTWNTNTFT